MRNKKGRADAVLALLLLASFVLACSSLKNLSSNPTEEANKLVRSAETDLDAVDKIIDENEDKSSELTKAENEKDAGKVKSTLDDIIGAIDQGVEHGQSAVDKIDKASKMNVDEKYKEYLSLKAQAFRKQIDAFKSLREAAVIERDNYGKGGEVEKKAVADFREKYNSYKKQLNEAKDLHRKANDIARQNPDKIKPA
ncbi:MAG TPA: hypothetical protein VD966_07600 [Pyrinomonadaceae bacterium]|nr:hypothetical protein [Pyrinomonadaceae bacterium]